MKATTIEEKLQEGLHGYTLRAIGKWKSIRALARGVYIYGSSYSSIKNYVDIIKAFCHWKHLDPDEAITTKRDWAKTIEEYVEYMMVERDLAGSTISSRVGAISSWLRSNGIEAKPTIRRPRRWNVERDRIPTRDELRKIIAPAHPCDKALALVALSSGLRTSTLLQLRIKDVKLEEAIPTIFVLPEMAKRRPRNGHVTFMTREARRCVQDYLRARRKKGETMTGDSYLFTNIDIIGKPLKSSISIVWSRWSDLLKAAGLDMLSKRHRILHFHTLRKYFLTYCKLSGMNYWVAEALMGHRSGLQRIYFRGVEGFGNQETIEFMKREYSKAIPALTVFSNDKPIIRYVDKSEALFMSRQELTPVAHLKGMQKVYVNDLSGIENSLRLQEEELEEIRKTISELVRALNSKSPEWISRRLKLQTRELLPSQNRRPR